jgi:hypothetical protein
MKNVALLALSFLLQADPFPVGDGSRWVYTNRMAKFSAKVGEPGPMLAGPARTITCTAGKEFVTLSGSDGKRMVAIVTADGVYETSVDPANLFLKFPLKKFDTWGKGDKKNALSTFVNHGEVTIEVPAGKFTCWKIEEQRILPRGSFRRTRWYARGVGLVSEESIELKDGEGTRRVLELESCDLK